MTETPEEERDLLLWLMGYLWMLQQAKSFGLGPKGKKKEPDWIEMAKELHEAREGSSKPPTEIMSSWIE